MKQEGYNPRTTAATHTKACKLRWLGGVASWDDDDDSDDGLCVCVCVFVVVVVVVCDIVVALDNKSSSEILLSDIRDCATSP